MSKNEEIFAKFLEAIKERHAGYFETLARDGIRPDYSLPAYHAPVPTRGSMKVVTSFVAARRLAA